MQRRNAGTGVAAAALTALGLAAVCAPAWSHHSFAAEFDVSKPIQLEGTIVRVEWVNPHSWFHLQVEDGGDEPVVWMIEGGSPNSLIRRGVTQQSVPPGLQLAVEGYQARDGSNTAVGRSFLLANGERLFLGGSAERVVDPAQ